VGTEILLVRLIDDIFPSYPYLLLIKLMHLLLVFALAPSRKLTICIKKL
jgi:hypothetical protein